METACALLAESGGAAMPEWLRWFHIEQGWQVGLVVFGLLGQVVFFMRWVIQWLASERRGESHVPVLFWWCSLAGGTMLLAYFVLRRDPVGIIGQATGWMIYARNLWLIRKKRQVRTAG